jgi:undecaprenyl-diphosphatase
VKRGERGSCSCYSARAHSSQITLVFTIGMSIGSEAQPSNAECHWLQGRDHESNLLGTTPASAESHTARTMDAVKQSRRGVLVRTLDWLGAHEAAVLIALAAIAAGVWMFVLLADKVMEGGLQAFDRKILLAMRRPGDLAPIGPLAIQEAARDITALGGPAVLGMVTVLTAGFLVLDGKRRMALFLCSAVASGFVFGMLLKDFFNRPRPDIVPQAVAVSTSSFPSGHAMMSALTYMVLGALLARSQERRALKAYFLLVAALLAFLVGVSRVYLGVHWPTDVLAGWTAGAVWALMCGLVARWLQNRGTLERESEHAPVP